MPAMEIVERFHDLDAKTASWREEGARIGFIPTMGALHKGHMALVRAAKAQCNKVVVSIFVNPRQFAHGEDLSRYPRMLGDDIKLLQEHEADLLFIPRAETLYPPGFTTSVNVDGLSAPLCGRSRPGHFSGVATVVAILLNAVRPAAAFFGEKDYQQYLIIKRMAVDLRLVCDIVPIPTSREEDGLARSSRNRYLTPEERRVAPVLYRTLLDVREKLCTAPRRAVEPLLAQGKKELEASGFGPVDYLEIRHHETLELPPATQQDWKDFRLFAAAGLGQARLIDNISLSWNLPQGA